MRIENGANARAFAFKILVIDTIFRFVYNGTQMTQMERILHKFSFFLLN
jgi:hypothetical protein